MVAPGTYPSCTTGSAAAAHLAEQLEPELSQLGLELVGLQHQERKDVEEFQRRIRRRNS